MKDQNLSHERIAQVRERLVTWVAKDGRDFSWRSPGTTPFQILVAEFLLKRTTAAAAAKVYQTFLQRYPDPDSLVRSSMDSLAEVLSPVGLNHQRALGFKAMAQYLAEHHLGEVPSGLEDLLAVPQVGDYTARAVLSFGFDKPAAIVDSNVLRVLGRLCKDTLGPAPKIGDVQQLAEQLLPIRDHKLFNWGLLDLGALICRYDKPRCVRCPLMSECDYTEKTS